MSYKVLFNDKELELIRNSFPIIFELIAESDTKIDKKEKNAYNEFLSNIRKLNSPIINEIFFNDITNAEVLNNNNNKELKNSLRLLNEILDLKLEREEQIEFKKILIAFGYYIAQSSGSLFDHKFSDDEEDILNEIGYILNISVRDLFLSGEIEKILNKLK